MSRQQLAEEFGRPTFERLRHQRVICKGERRACSAPGLVPLEFEFIYENPHQFGHGNRRMRIIELDCGVLAEGSDVSELFHMTTNDVSQGGRSEEIFLT